MGKVEDVLLKSTQVFAARNPLGHGRFHALLLQLALLGSTIVTPLKSVSQPVCQSGILKSVSYPKGITSMSIPFHPGLWTSIGPLIKTRDIGLKAAGHKAGLGQLKADVNYLPSLNEQLQPIRLAFQAISPTNP